MAKEPPGHAHNISKLNVVFALSSIALFLTTIWMIWSDYSREWKGYQREFIQLERELTRRQLEEAQAEIDREELARLGEELEAAEAALAENQSTIDELEAEKEELEAAWYLADVEERELKSIYDSQKFFFEEGEHAPLGRGVDEESFRELERQFFEARNTRIALDYKREQVEGQLAELQSRRAEILAKRRSLTERIDLIERKMNTIKASFPNLFRNLPVVDFIDPSIEVRQVLVRNVTTDLNFTEVPRIDRCMTCHLGIDNPDFADAPQPFATHPNLDLFVKRESPHPVDSFGCTSCHRGRGRAMTFVRATHTPRDETQRAEWEEEYDWVEEHYWNSPMYPADFSESGCLKCHADTVHVPQAPNFNRGRDLYEKTGCWGCHNTKGFEDRRKVGPNLDHIVSKTTPEFAARWVKDPKAFKASTFMPRFWNLENNPDDEVGARNDTEVASIVAYIFDKADRLTYGPVPEGDRARGRELVESVGCLGCHITDEAEAETADFRRRHGPSLDGLGSKVNERFLFHWLKNPKHYWADTFMPDLRLTDSEAADITAYLMSKKNPEFEALPVPAAEPAALEAIALEFLRTGLPDQVARERLGKMSKQEKLIYSGENLIRRYGCFGCHDIRGFENAQKIGVDLSDWGSKMVTRLDFGYIDIEHTRRAWLEQKLRNPRGFDRGKVKRPEEKLRMPYFGFDDAEVKDMARAVLAQVKDEFPLEAVKRLDAREAVAENARRVIHEYNCQGCHLIDGQGGAIYSSIEDPGMRPPNLNTQGAKTKANWLFHFLKEPSTVRFWLKVRMPTFQFSDEEANALVQGFMAMEDAQPFETTETSVDPRLLREGATLLTRLRCEQCHIASAVGTMSASQLAPSFRLTGERLRREWIVDWLEDPQRIAPGTQMPQFWPKDDEGNIITPVPEYMDGDPMKQMQAVATYLMNYNR